MKQKFSIAAQLEGKGVLFFCLFIFYLLSSSSASGNRLSGDTLTSGSPGKEVRIYNTQRLSTPKPVINGVLDDACWKTGTWAGDFIQFVPNEGAKPSQPTFVKVLYDDKNLYVAIRAMDNEPSKIQRKAGRRDELTGDMIGITFDSYHDHRTGFEFDMSASGQKIDLVLTNPMLWDLNWNAVWYGKVAIGDSAWTSEMEIPLSQLRYSNQDEQVWGMHVWRWIDRLQEESDWERQSLTGPGGRTPLHPPPFFSENTMSQNPSTFFARLFPARIRAAEALEQQAQALLQAQARAADLEAQVTAIGRAQAVIEFKLDGTILNANDNFLNVMGYTLDEVRGKHHSMFADTGVAQTPEYRHFWDKLGRVAMAACSAVLSCVLQIRVTAVSRSSAGMLRVALHIRP